MSHSESFFKFIIPEFNERTIIIISLLFIFVFIFYLFYKISSSGPDSNSNFDSIEEKLNGEINSLRETLDSNSQKFNELHVILQHLKTPRPVQSITNNTSQPIQPVPNLKLLPKPQVPTVQPTFQQYQAPIQSQSSVKQKTTPVKIDSDQDSDSDSDDEVQILNDDDYPENNLILMS